MIAAIGAIKIDGEWTQRKALKIAGSCNDPIGVLGLQGIASAIQSVGSMKSPDWDSPLSSESQSLLWRLKNFGITK